MWSVIMVDERGRGSVGRSVDVGVGPRAVVGRSSELEARPMPLLLKCSAEPRGAQDGV